MLGVSKERWFALPSRSSAGWNKGEPSSSGHLTPPAACKPSDSLSKHIETIYTHITQLDENHLSADKGLLTLLVAFGQDRKAMTPKPTAELSEILEAIGEVPTDETGVESTFTTVAEILR